jgi:tetrahydromethanopterin S-methyltransferase subunit A
MTEDVFIKELEQAGWPQEFHEKLHVGNLKSSVGIATLWTYQDVVFKGLNPESYAVVGNYYDRRNAFEPFVRNCLANPNIRL